MSDYRVNLDIFAGPMDLLLYLIRKDEVDIYDIPISQITDQYIHYIDMLKSFDIDLAGDFLVMAATLMHIKSAMLLPKAEVEDGEQEDEYIDPRSELIGQLLEYKKFKDAANLLESAAENKQQRFSRPATIIDNLKPEAEPELDMDQVNVWDLLEAFDRVMKATGSYFDISHIKDDTPIDLYQIDILSNLQVSGPKSFESIFEGARTKIKMVGMFLAILELSRDKLIWIEQDDASKSLFVKALTDEEPEKAVQRAILANEEEELLEMQEKMEKAELGAVADSQEDTAAEAQEETLEEDLEEDLERVLQEEQDEDETIEEVLEHDVEEVSQEQGESEAAEEVCEADLDEGQEELEVVEDLKIPIVEIPAEKKKMPIQTEMSDVEQVSGAGAIPIVELPADSGSVRQHEQVENTAEED